MSLKKGKKLKQVFTDDQVAILTKQYSVLHTKLSRLNNLLNEELLALRGKVSELDAAVKNKRRPKITLSSLLGLKR